MHLEHAHEGRSAPVTAVALFIASRADGEQVPLGEDRPRFVERDCAHAFHPWRIRTQISSARFAAGSVVRMRVGHGRVNPSEAHLRVASMPILLPYAGRSL